MPVLILRSQDGSIIEREFAGELRIGAAPDNDLRVIAGQSIAPYHAAIARSDVYHVPVLVHLAGPKIETKVGGRRVIRLKTLRHKDVVELGRAHLEFWELIIRRVVTGSQIDGKVCPVCYSTILSGEEVIICPRCQIAHHKECWFLLSLCSTYACGYPVQETLRRVLAQYVRFEKLTEEHKFVREQLHCAAGNPRDRGSLKDEKHIVYCPNPDCNKAYHVECWLLLERCPHCSHDIKALLHNAFVPTAAASAGPGNGS